jgi:hypothetical protein
VKAMSEVDAACYGLPEGGHSVNGDVIDATVHLASCRLALHRGPRNQETVVTYRPLVQRRPR